MTTNYTQFINVLLQAFTDFVSDPEASTWIEQMETQVRYNVQKRKVEEIKLDSGLTYTTSIAGTAQADWRLFAITCVGKGVLNTTGKDAAGVTISGVTPLYGVALASGVTVPGIIFFSTYNLTAAPTITSQADGSVFQIYDATCVEDGG